MYLDNVQVSVSGRVVQRRRPRGVPVPRVGAALQQPPDDLGRTAVVGGEAQRAVPVQGAGVHKACQAVRL